MTERPRLPPKPSHLSTWRSVRGHSPTPSEVAAAQLNSDDEDDDVVFSDLASSTIDLGTARPVATPAAASSSSTAPQRTPLKDIWANRAYETTQMQASQSHSSSQQQQQQTSLSAASHSKYASALSTLRGAPYDEAQAAWSDADAAEAEEERPSVDVASWLRAGGAESHAGRPPSLAQHDTVRLVATPPPQKQQQQRLSTLLRKQGRRDMHASSSTAVPTLKARPVELRQQEEQVERESSAEKMVQQADAEVKKQVPQAEEELDADVTIAAAARDEPVEDTSAEQSHQRSSSTVKAEQEEIASKPALAAAAPAITSAEEAAPQPDRPLSVVLDLTHLDDATCTLASSSSSSVPLIVAPAPPLRAPGKPARALYDFAGEATFNELSLRAGECFEVLAPELRGGWSLGLLSVRDEVTGAVSEKRGLVPVGWYCYIQDFATSPAVAASVSASAAAPASPLQLATTSDTDVSSTSPPSVDSALPSSVFTLAPSASNGSMLSVHSSSSASSHAHAQAHARPHDEDPRKRPASGVGTFLKGNGCALKTLEAIHDGSASAAATAGGTVKAAKVEVPADREEEEEVALPTQQTQQQTSSAPASAPATAAWRGPSGLLGGRTFNRFSPFVASGAESFILSPSSSAAAEVSADATARRRLYRSRSGSVEANDELGSISGTRTTTEATAQESAAGSAHYIVSGAHGPAWKARAAPFHVVVHSPEARWDSRGAEYTAYAVTSLFGGGGASSALKLPDDGTANGSGEASWQPYDSELPPAHSHESLSVWRRFSHFHWLGLYLARALPALALSLPPTPPKTRAGRARLASEFVEERRRGLASWLARVVRHPVARTDEGLLFFLGCAEEHDWNACAPRLLADATRRAGLFARTFHAQFGFDVDEAHEAASRLDSFNDAFEKGMSEGAEGVLGAFARKREAAALSGDAYRGLSHALLRLTTGHGLGGAASAAREVDVRGDEDQYYGPAMGALGERGDSGATNEEGAWCWRADCKECLATTRALQSTAQALDNVADVYDDHARGALLLQHERLRALSRPRAQHSALMDVHKTTLARYREATGEELDVSGAPSEERATPAPEALALAARCETVLNVTMAEMDRVHAERVEDWVSAGRNLLDDQIALYSEILATLQEARAAYDPVPLGTLATRGPILPGVQSAPLRRAPARPAALPQPTAPVVAPSVLSSALRPVSLAGEVLGSLFSGGSPNLNDAGPTAPQMSQRSISAGAGSGASRFGFWR